MKKLIWLMVLGVLFFIGGQWWGLSLSEKNRIDAAASVEVIHAEDSVPDAQNGSASEVRK